MDSLSWGTGATLSGRRCGQEKGENETDTGRPTQLMQHLMFYYPKTNISQKMNFRLTFNKKLKNVNTIMVF